MKRADKNAFGWQSKLPLNFFWRYRQRLRNRPLKSKLRICDGVKWKTISRILNKKDYHLQSTLMWKHSELLGSEKRRKFLTRRSSIIHCHERSVIACQESLSFECLDNCSLYKGKLWSNEIDRLLIFLLDSSIQIKNAYSSLAFKSTILISLVLL